MTIYFPESILELPLIRKAAELLEAHADEYDIPNLDLKESTILDPVKNFLELYFDSNDEDRENKINYIAQTFYSVKGTYKVIQFLYLYNFLNSDSEVLYNSTKNLRITLRGEITPWPNYELDEEGNQVYVNENETIDYCSMEYINRFREFLKALLYFGSLDICLDNLSISIDLKNSGGIFADTELFIIEKIEE